MANLSHQSTFNTQRSGPFVYSLLLRDNCRSRLPHKKLYIHISIVSQMLRIKLKASSLLSPPIFRKREEKQKRVAEAKATRDREELDKKQRLIEEKHQMFQASEQARKKREGEYKSLN